MKSVGTKPNQIPLNEMLGSMAYQDVKEFLYLLEKYASEARRSAFIAAGSKVQLDNLLLSNVTKSRVYFYGNF